MESEVLHAMFENIITLGVDWLTLVADPRMAGSAEITEWMEGQDIFSASEGRPWRFFGYEGWMYDGVGYGVRNDGCILQIRSSRAEELFSVLPVGLRATRLDLQVTILASQVVEVAKDAYNEGRGNKPLPQLKYTLLRDDTGGGGTCYVGSRSSMQYGRIYDKGDQLKQTGKGQVGKKRLWRYEVELKSDRADEVYQALFHVKQDTSNYISQYVFSWFRERGIIPYFEPGGLNLEIIRVVQESMFEDPLMRKLVWLRSSVSPVIRELVRNGMEQEARDALGLDTEYSDYDGDDLYDPN